MKLRKSFQIAVLFVLMGILADGCGENRENSRADKGKIDEQSELLQHFMKENSGKEVIKSALKDLNNDGKEDLIVMYRVSEDKNMMRVILDMGGTYVNTNEVPAPYSNQAIQFRDIDDKPPMEFIVQGMKGAGIGFAVFRIEENQLVDLFGEGMEECC